jgi:hypothetical protein
VTVSKVKGISHNGGISDETADDQRGDGSHLRPLCPSVGAEHWGKFVAVSLDGRVLLGEEELAVFQEALRDFGSGNFVMMRVGLKVVGKIRESVISEQQC